jgi:hypothetical protein
VRIKWRESSESGVGMPLLSVPCCNVRERKRLIGGNGEVEDGGERSGEGIDKQETETRSE